MSNIEVLVYSANGSTLIAMVADVLAVSALDELEGQGGGSLTIAYDNVTLAANATLLDAKNVVKVRVDGTIVGAFLIRNIEEVIVGAGGESAQAWTVSGPGLLAWLDEAVVYPEFFSVFGESTRWFGWGSEVGSWYDSTEWGSPTRVRKRGGSDFSDPTNRWRGRPENWPDCDPKAWWVWDRPDADVAAPDGRCYFRYTLSVGADDTPYTLYVTADNNCEIQLDGEPLAKVAGSLSHHYTYGVNFSLDAGTHIIGIRARNRGRGGGLLAALFSFVEGSGGAELSDEFAGTQITATGQSGWKMLAYPTTEPGWSAGEVIADLVAEADVRTVASTGYLNGDDFSDTVDSAGTAWTDYVWQFGVGDSYTSVVEQMSDYDVQVRVNPDTRVLSSWVSKGSDLSTTIMLTSGTSAVAVDEQVENRIVNGLLFADEDGWKLSNDATSIAAYGRIETFLNLTSLPTRSAAKIAAKTIALYAVPVEGVTFDYVPTGSGDVPWTDFNTGDTITVQTTAGGTTSRKVVSIAVGKDPQNGDPVYSIELDAVSMDLIDRLQRIIDRLGGGDGGPASRVPGGPGGGVPGTTPRDPGGGGPGGGGPNYRPADPVRTPPSDDPWIDPNDPEFEQPNPGDPFEGVLGVGQVAKTVATDMIGAWATYGDPLYLALCHSAPVAVVGAWTLVGVELTDTGYARQAVAMSVFDAATGNDPVTRTSNVAIDFAGNTSGGDWTEITHVAILNNAQDTVLSSIALPSPIVVGDTEAVQVPSGLLQLIVDSV